MIAVKALSVYTSDNPSRLNKVGISFKSSTLLCVRLSGV